MQILKKILTNPYFLIIWGIMVIASITILIYDLRRNNYHLSGMMKWVWGFTVIYSGPLGLLIYFYSGRKEMARDSTWRRGFRSVAHCYSGCGAGEIIGVLVAAGLLSLGIWWIAGITFLLAYVAGFALTMGPLMQEGVDFNQALRDAFYSESVSIAVMEVVAIGVDIWFTGGATMGEPLFWASLVLSLSAGLLAAYPVNVLLVHFGVKHGMQNPKNVSATT